MDFSVQKLSELTLKSHLLQQTLIDNECEVHIHHLSQILLSANQKNETDFKKLVVSRELFGGAGALWEIHIANPTEYQKFNNQFSEYIDLLIRMGIRNARVLYIRKTMPKLN
jgi:hypothetical protein